jgi:hypothetical protein
MDIFISLLNFRRTHKVVRNGRKIRTRKRRRMKEEQEEEKYKSR